MTNLSNLPLQLGGTGGSDESGALRLIAAGLAATVPWMNSSQGIWRMCRYCHLDGEHSQFCCWRLSQLYSIDENRQAQSANSDRAHEIEILRMIAGGLAAVDPFNDRICLYCDGIADHEPDCTWKWSQAWYAKGR